VDDHLAREGEQEPMRVGLLAEGLPAEPRGGLRGVAALPGGEHQAMQRAVRIDRGVQLGGQPAAGSAGVARLAQTRQIDVSTRLH
jgi:hypothetical protein